MKKKVCVEFKGNVDNFGIRIDDKKPKLEKGVGCVELQAGVHFLTFFVIAPPGTKFTIAITAPHEAKWKREITVPANGVVVGSKKFTINKN